MSSGPQNDMFIAREVIITNKDEIDNLPPELLFPNNTETTTIIKNKNELPMLKDNEIYCLSNDVIGFVEVSSRIFYLPEEQQQQQGMIKQYRPVLTNLAVKKSARRSGVGKNSNTSFLNYSEVNSNTLAFLIKKNSILIFVSYLTKVQH